MAEGAADGGHRDAGVAAGGFGDLVAGLDSAVLVRPPQDVHAHAVFDTAGKVQVFGLGVDDADPATVAVVDSQQRRVAHQNVNGLQTLGNWAASLGLGHPHLLLSESAGDATKIHHTNGSLRLPDSATAAHVALAAAPGGGMHAAHHVECHYS